MGRSLLLADVHANLRALEAVLLDARRGDGFDSIWMLGDLVGYGPEPDECVARLREHPLVCVAGNHDLGVVGDIDLSRFNPDAATACLWSRRRLSASSIRFLRELPLEYHLPPFLLVHGSPRDPVWEYVVSPGDALLLASFCDETHCLTGHTHRSCAYRMVAGPALASTSGLLGLEVVLDGRLIINPGAVGQPRDGDPRAAYAVLDSDAKTVTFRRVAYDVCGTAADMLRNGLPVALARRLHAGG
ncbi:MAG TPA: metallophosphoesterase [Propionibacteriaceae bacterium]|nr:metallophosphoesterase [Propionibacteriaceae bacterium]